MKFVDAIKTCFSKYVTFEGRASRPEFWWFMLFCALAVLVAESVVGEGFSGLVTLALLLPAVSVATRRLHDIGRTGWWQLIGVVPLLGTLVLLFWYVQPSQAFQNKYDPL